MSDLIIPVLVEAFLSNGKTSDHKKVPVVSPDYKKVSYTSFLGSKNTPGDFQCQPALEAGVHLHFVLPDALTKDSGEGYPAVPDRYVVTRLYVEEDSRIRMKCFVVESNFISMDLRYRDSVTIPWFEESDPRKNWRYLGRTYGVGEEPRASDTDGYLDKLVAVGAGDPMFSAYYPSCHSVFGFHDTMDDVPLNTSVSYFVCGYYSHDEQNPFAGVESREKFKEILEKMKLSVEDSKSWCNRLYLFGEISGIVWKGTEENYSFETGETIDVAMGNTSAEALSAAVVRFTGIPKDRERFLTALQYDLGDSGKEWDGNFKIEDEMFFRQFQRMDGGEKPQELVISKDRKKREEEEEGSDMREQKLQLGRCYSAYTMEKRKLSRLQQLLAYRRASLFYSWEQYMLCYENPKTTPSGVPSKEEMMIEIARIIKEDIGGLKTEIIKQEDVVKESRAALDAVMEKGTELSDAASEPFYVPKDPVLLLSGSGIKRRFAFGENGRFTNDGTLLAQTKTVTANIEKGELSACLVGMEHISLLPDIYKELLYQAILLSVDCQPLIEKKIRKIEISANFPCELSLNVYHSDAIILFMEWEAAYYPVKSGERLDDTFKNWSYTPDDMVYRYEGSLTPQQITPLFFSGRSLLTPHAVIQFSNVLKKWMEVHSDDPELSELAEEIKNLDVISQNLDGFTKGFLALKQTFEFPIVGTGGDEELASEVGKQVLEERVSIMPERQVFHLRGGYIGMNRLSLVGTFGQIQNISDSSYFGKKEICFSETMEQHDSGCAILPLAFTDPVRLDFDFLSAKDDEVLSSAAPGTSPIYGIILPELLNGRLLIYQSDGRFLGSINTAFRDGKPCARWVDGEQPERKFKDAQIADQRLYAFIKGILEVEDALRDLFAMIEQYYSVKLRPNENNCIWGRPFILARCQLAFRFFGEPEWNKQIEDFGKYNTFLAEEIRVPVFFGAMDRVSDGVLGCFCDEYGFERICPSFGIKSDTYGDYLLPSNQFGLSASDGEKKFTLFMEPHAAATIHTGILPVKQVSVNAAHTEFAEHLYTVAEMNPLITGKENMELPMDGFAWRYQTGESYMQSKAVQPMVDFGAKVIMDGFIVKEEKDVERNHG